MAKKAGWDTQYGYELYLQGKSDGEIADACRVQTSTVTAYRLRRWRKMPDGGRQDAPPVEDSGTDKGSGTELAHHGAQEGHDPPLHKDEEEFGPAEAGKGEDDMKKLIDTAEKYPAEEIPVTYPCLTAVEETPAADPGQRTEVWGDAVEYGDALLWEARYFGDMRRKLDLVAEATEEMSGIRAICTAGAIEALWKWENREALYKARAYIDYMINESCHGYG